MQVSSKKGFTMIELIFVIVVIGILSAIAIPKLAATRDDATITKAIATVGSVRSAVATERQKRILKGDFTHPVETLHTSGSGNAFDVFNADKDSIQNRVLEYSMPDCTSLGKSSGCWKVSGSGASSTYTYVMPTSGDEVDFNITAGRFDCKVPTNANCKLLTQ